MSNKDEMISQFADVTGVETERARFYLESAAWKLEVALASFYENDGDQGADVEELPQIEEIPPRPSPIGASHPSKPKPKASASSRFGTVASLSQPEGSSDEEEGQAFYAGGSERSGQQVLGPGKKKKDIVSEVFKSVQEHGAEVVEPRQQSSRKPQTFSGQGYRLGQSSNDTEVVGTSAAQRRESHSEVILKLWKDGFSVNDGPYREYSDPENREFLESVRRGEIPHELLSEAHGSEVHLDLEDHRHEDYMPSKPKVRAFSGKGHVLGSTNTSDGDSRPTPATIGITKPMDEKDREANEEHAKKVIPVDDNQPKTTIQIRLADGSRLVGHFNHNHTIGDIRRYITTARPQYQNQNFNLLTSFPSKLLSDENASLTDAGVLNAALLQRMA